MSELNDLFYKVFQNTSVATMVIAAENDLCEVKNRQLFKDDEKAAYKNFKIIHTNYSLQKLFAFESKANDLFIEQKLFKDFVENVYQNINYRINNFQKKINFDYICNNNEYYRAFNVYVDFFVEKSIYFIITIVDASENYKNRSILDEFVEKHYLLLRYINDSIVLFDINNLTIVEFNNNFKKIIKNDIFSDSLNILDFFKDENLKKFSVFFDKKIKNVFGENDKITLFLSVDNKNKIPVEINIFFSTLNSNKVAQLVIRDLRNQFELEEGKQILATAVDQSAESIMITDTNGIIQYVNPAFERISGYSLSEIMGKKPNVLKSGKTPAYTYKIMWDEIKQGKSWRGVLINKSKKGILYKEDTTITPVKGKNNKITNYVAVKRDITHSSLLEEQIRQNQKMQAIGTLAGGIAHDFNNILTAIMGYAELSQAQCEINSLLYSNLTEIIKGTDRAGQLVDQILKFSRKSEKNVSSVNLNNIVKDVVKLIRASIPANINLMYDALHDFYIKADPTQVSQIIMNLCTNAYQALEGSTGSISIKIFSKELSQKQGIEVGNIQKGKYVCLQIEDNGVGIPQEYKHRIFEPFFTTKKLHEGTGLGLAVVHGIVNDHRGAITVESTPGKGSCFTVYFPEAREAEITPESTSHITPQKKIGTILVVDDEESITQFVSQVLTHLGYKVESCCSSKKAKQIFTQKKEDIDLVITDMGMPELTGIELAKAIQKIKPGLPIIMCTGYSDKISADNYSRKGLAGFIAKPFNAEQLYREVDRVMKNSPSGSTYIRVS